MPTFDPLRVLTVTLVVIESTGMKSRQVCKAAGFIMIVLDLLPRRRSPQHTWPKRIEGGSKFDAPLPRRHKDTKKRQAISSLPWRLRAFVANSL